ncbi:MAG: cupin domain-containing protein [Acidobacteriota bacterium]|nr:cupin domain-containing protein [Acidobacteriota bacterium]MDQ2843769.1 cupin domain-containing protein [Acidobacteriota bacterium]
MNQTDLLSFSGGTAGLGRTTMLLRENGLRTLLLHLKAGEQIPEHQTRGAITVHCLKGEAIFQSGDERVQLRPALLFSLAPGTPHSVVAQQDTLLLVTISEQIQSEQIQAS